MHRQPSAGRRLPLLVLTAFLPFAGCRTVDPPAAAEPVADPGDRSGVVFVVGGEVGWVAADGSAETVIEHGLDRGGEVMDPALSPSGDRIAFASCGFEPDLYVIPAGGGTAEMIDPLPDQASMAPSWSPDGEWIAFGPHYPVEGSVIEPEIVVVRADGGEHRRLTDTEGIDEVPAWSPDGHRIAYVRRPATPDGNRDIWVMDADGANTRPLTTHEARDTSPTWSPDGRSIAFVSNRGGDAGVWIVDIDGGEWLVTDAEGRDVDPDWR